MARPPRIFTIPPGLPFADTLASGLLARYADDPLALADLRVLLPTRRACRALTEAFLRQSGGAALLLPALTPVGDIDDDDIAFAADEDWHGADAIDLPPAIADMRRRLLLAEMIRRAGAAGGGAGAPAQAALLAEELARLLDRVQTEGLSFDGLAALVPDDYAHHWRITLEFLEIVISNWPAVLAEEGCIDPAERRNRLIAAQAALWRRSPPAAPVIAAGSTGSIPATASLLEVVAGLPAGEVILPGLDTEMDEATLAALGPTHPQYTMVRLLERLGVAPRDVTGWDGVRADGHGAARTALCALAMRPAAAGPGVAEPASLGQSVAGIRRVDCPGAQEEAVVIALAMREALDTEGRTAALVTPDRGLARRVAVELQRWGVAVDDSAGQPLAETAPGVFLRLVARLAAERLAPVPLLSALKHPLANGGMSAAAFRANVRALERAALRGPRPGPGIAGLRRALAGRGEDRLARWLDGLAAMLAPLLDVVGRRAAPLSELLAAHVASAEALAADDGVAGADRLWAGEAGEAARDFVAELAEAGATHAPIPGADWPALFETLMGGRVVRPRYGRHPRLHIWGPLEARLQRADLLILGGLNEGTWPPDPGADPWMSRQMRAEFGLPPLERRIGLAAHDFVQAFAAPELMLTRATRVEGTPTVPSRWLLRLDNVLRAAGMEGALAEAQPAWLAWQGWLDEPADEVQIRAPAPSPPVAARPRRLSVTQVETLIRDPYAVYARHVLRLRPLEPIDADPGAADRGNIVHDALDAFLREFPDALPDDALARLLALGERTFGEVLSRPGVRAFWWPRFERVARWFVETERARRHRLAATHTEVQGELVIAAPGGPFTLSARADRIDALRGGGLAIVDYKTGMLPSKADIAAGLAPQLPLEAAIARAGGFADVAAAPVETLAFWRLSGGDPPGEEVAAGDDIAELADAALAGLVGLIAAYDDPESVYASRPDPERAPRFSDYDHLARVGEWSAGGGGDG